MRTYPAQVVASELIYEAQGMEWYISPVELENMLYFVQGSSLLAYGIPAFLEDMEAWGAGPVVPSVYYRYNQYGALSIPYLFRERYNVGNKMTAEDKEFIRFVVKGFRKYRYTSFLGKAAREEDPWRDAYQPEKHNIIPMKNIQKYFMGKYAEFTATKGKEKTK